MAELTQELILSLFDYRDGNLFWKVLKTKSVKIGDLAGTLRIDGYRMICVNYKLYPAHRLIFLYHHGYLPKFLDHIDGNPSNNDINNLREATSRENNRNAKKRKSVNGKPTSSKYKGVYWDKRDKKWRVQIMSNGKRKSLGYFDSEIESAKTYDRAALEVHGEFAKLNFDDDHNVYKVGS